MARICTLAETPTTDDTAPGFVTVTEFAGGEIAAVTVQVNLVVPKAPVVSVAVTVTEDEPATVGVPEINPVDALIDNPAGKPEALYDNVDPAESLARICTIAAVPTTDDTVPGFVTVTVFTGGGDVVPALNAPIPFGVPKPVGPSQPTPAVQIDEPPHEPFPPVITSLSCDRFAYGSVVPLSVTGRLPANA